MSESTLYCFEFERPGTFDRTVAALVRETKPGREEALVYDIHGIKHVEFEDYVHPPRGQEFFRKILERIGASDIVQKEYPE